MARVKRGNVARKRRKKVLDLAKGFRGGLSKLFRPAHQVVLHALVNATEHRRLKKRDFRVLWINRISGALYNTDLSYSKFIGGLVKNQVKINRKMLSELAIHEPAIFDQIVGIAAQK